MGHALRLEKKQQKNPVEDVNMLGNIKPQP